MVDWPGLLKYSLKYTDGTTKSHFKPMDPEDQRWLEQALEHYATADSQRIRDIIAEIEKSQQEPPAAKVTVALLEELQQRLQTLDRGDSFYLMGGGRPLLSFILRTDDQQALVVALRIFAFINQNDAKVQKMSDHFGALTIMQLLVRKESCQKVLEAAVSAVSALVRGEYLQGKRRFIDADGVEIIVNCLGVSERCKDKAMTLLADLLFYDERLHLLVNDTSAFSNTNSVRLAHKEVIGKGALDYDPNAKLRQENQLPELARFKGLVKAKLNGMGLLQQIKEHDRRMKGE